MKYQKTITAEIIKCDITKLDEIQSFVGETYRVKLDGDCIEIEDRQYVVEDRCIPAILHLENNSFLIKYEDGFLGLTNDKKDWHPILNLPKKKTVIDKSKWNRALDGVLPEHEQEVFYWFEHTGLNLGTYECAYCEELNCNIHIFYSPMGFLSDEDVYWLPVEALPFEYIYEKEE